MQESVWLLLLTRFIEKKGSEGGRRDWLRSRRTWLQCAGWFRIQPADIGSAREDERTLMGTSLRLPWSLWFSEMRLNTLRSHVASSPGDALLTWGPRVCDWEATEPSQ